MPQSSPPLAITAAPSLPLPSLSASTYAASSASAVSPPACSRSSSSPSSSTPPRPPPHRRPPPRSLLHQPAPFPALNLLLRNPGLLPIRYRAVSATVSYRGHLLGCAAARPGCRQLTARGVTYSRAMPLLSTCRKDGGFPRQLPGTLSSSCRIHHRPRSASQPVLLRQATQEALLLSGMHGGVVSRNKVGFSREGVGRNVALQKENGDDLDMAEMIASELESLSNQLAELEEKLKKWSSRLVTRCSRDRLLEHLNREGGMQRFRILLKRVITKLCSRAGGGVRRLNGRVNGTTGEGGGRRPEGRALFLTGRQWPKMDNASGLEVDINLNFQRCLFVPWAWLITAIGISALIVGLWPMHVIWTYYCIIRTKLVGPVVKLLLACFLLLHL